MGCKPGCRDKYIKPMANGILGDDGYGWERDEDGMRMKAEMAMETEMEMKMETDM